MSLSQAYMQTAQQNFHTLKPGFFLPKFSLEQFYSTEEIIPPLESQLAFA